ncbi:ProP effector [Candidatus Providencia siddallii]|uniref:ProP effector n=1 Tax=Candidatus Providencia siddallii TaxID=1715285 RepID=A0A0M6W7B0_9GAMM|nr:ProP effector [Candidatus Providencia siddallii]
MKNQLKLNNKKVISFLVKSFPYCFFVKGLIRPLKIGIFHDIAKRLIEKDCISRTQLRSALRMYTSSKRYLCSMKNGINRIDLDGKDCGELKSEHIIYSSQQLIKLKTRIQSQCFKQKMYITNIVRKKNIKIIKNNNYNKRIISCSYSVSGNKKDQRNDSLLQDKTCSKKEFKSVANINTIKVGQTLKIKIGSSVVDAFILEITKDFFRVQLSSGLAMIVRSKHLTF